MQDIYSDEFDTPPACKPPLVTLKVRIKKDQDYRGYSDIIRIDKGDNNITFTSLYHNRQIHKQKIQKGGIKRLNQSPFEVFGFRLFDRVMFENSYYFIFGRRKTGSFNIRDIDGKSQKNITYKKFKLSRCKRFMIQKEMN